MKEDILLTEGIIAGYERGVFSASKNGKTVTKKLDHPRIKIEIDSGKIIISSLNENRNDKKLVKTYTAHVKNLIKGIVEPYIYTLKVCSSHFPMDVSVQGKEVVIKNFLGERIPRKAEILDGADVKVQGDIVTVTGNNKEITGQTAANIERATRLTLHDRRRFQDGIYITSKAGVLI